MWLGGRPGRRLQMAALLSVSLHLALGSSCCSRTPITTEWGVGPKISLAKHELREIDTLPDYQMTGLTPVPSANNDLEKPVQSGLPNNLPDQQPVEIVRNQQPANPKPAAPAPSPAGMEAVQPQAKLAPAIAEAKPRPAESAAPRRGDLASTLKTRQPAPADASPLAAAITAPQAPNPIAAPAASTVEAHATPMGHQLLDPAVPRRPENDVVAMLPQVVQPGGPRPEAAPRTNDQQPTATIAVGPALVKTVTEPAAVPRGEAPAPAAPARHEQTAEQGAPRPATGVGRQAIAGAVVSRLPGARCDFAGSQGAAGGGDGLAGSARIDLGEARHSERRAGELRSRFEDGRSGRRFDRGRADRSDSTVDRGSRSRLGSSCKRPRRRSRAVRRPLHRRDRPART